MSCRSTYSTESSLIGTLDLREFPLDSEILRSASAEEELVESVVPHSEGSEDVLEEDGGRWGRSHMTGVVPERLGSFHYRPSLGKLREVFAYPRSSMWRYRTAKFAGSLSPL